MTDRLTLRALLRHPELHLSLVTPEQTLPEGSLDRPLLWLHSSDLLDPTPFLADDLALLTTGSQFAQRGPAHQIDYVVRLARRGIVAIGFGSDVAFPEIPAPLRLACADAGVPLFEVPYRTPFIAVARAHAEAVTQRLSTEDDELARQRGRLNAQLVASLLLDDPGLARHVRGSLPAEPVVVAVADPGEAGEALDEWWGTNAVAAEVDTGLVVCLSAADEERIDEAAARFGIRFGLSSATDYSRFSRAHAEAVAALRRGSTGVVRFRDARGSGLVTALHTEPLRAQARAFLAPLRATPLPETLRAWLAHDARLEPAAAELGIHRHTLRTRLAHAGKLLDRDLGTLAARAELWAALESLADEV